MSMNSRLPQAAKMLALAAALLLAGLTGSCTSTRLTVYQSSPQSSIDEANRLVAGKVATVILADERRFLASQVQISPTSTSWHDPETGESMQFENSRISHILLKSSSTGKSVALGFFVGFVTGFAVGIISTSHEDFQDVYSITPAVGGLLLGGLTGAIGALIGLSVGKGKDRIVIY